MTDEQGLAELGPVPVGSYGLRAERPGFLPVLMTTGVESDTTTHVSLTMRPALTLAGQVADTNGAHIPGVEARLGTPGGNPDVDTWPVVARSNARGEFRFQLDPSSGSRVLIFTHPGYLASDPYRPATSAGARNLRVVLARQAVSAWSRLLDYQLEIQGTLSFLPLAVAGGWLAWRRRRLKIVLERRSTLKRHAREGRGLPQPRHRLYRGAAFTRARIEVRRRRRSGPGQLDTDASAEASARRQGFFTPVYRQTLQLPVYLALVDRAGFRDQRARMVDELLDRLHEGGVELDRYDFARDPRLSVLRGSGFAHRDLRELAGLHPEHRLLLFGEGDGLLHPVTGHLTRWAELFSAWEHRALLTPVPVSEWSRREIEIERAGFRVLPATAAGLRCFAESLRDSDAYLPPRTPPGEERPPFPGSFARHPARWLERHPPELEELDELCGGLRDFLGSDGYRWLASLAVYPELEWYLTLYLGLHLRRPDGSAILDEATLTDLTRLPWLRQGSMPDWLRLRLIGELSQDDEAAVRRFLRDLLEQDLETSQFRLDVARPPEPEKAKGWERIRQWLAEKDWRRLLVDLVRTAPAPSSLRDQVFVGFLLGKKPQKLQVLAPGNWRRWVYERSIRALGPRPAVSLVLAVLMASAGYLSGGPLLESLSRAATPAAVSNVVESSPDKLPAPNPLTPDARSPSSPDPVFSWEQVDGAAFYTLEVCSDPDCVQPTERTTESARVQQAVPVGDHYWRVAAVDVAGVAGTPSILIPFSVESGSEEAIVERPPPRSVLDLIRPREFPVPRLRTTSPSGSRSSGEVRGELLAAPQPLTSASETRPNAPSPIFSWEPVPGASSYTVEVCSDPDCSQTVERGEDLTEATWSVSSTLTGDLYWRVTAVDAAGVAGTPSVAIPFSIEDMPEDLVSWVEDEVAKIPAEQRAAAVLAKVEAALPVAPERLRTIGTLAWALDYFPGRSGEGEEREKTNRVREQLVGPLRERHPSPPIAKEGWVEIPAGKFQMGRETDGLDERPIHEVSISPLRMLDHEVTNREYRRLVPAHRGEEELPAVGISWYQAYAYAAWLGGRLPTEAEWEYAARAGCPWEYCNRRGRKTRLSKVAWYRKNSKGVLNPTKQREPNPWGLYDMYGNAWEWVADWYGRYSSYPQVDPWGPSTGVFRVFRGGGFDVGTWGACAANRGRKSPENRDRGFRVVIPVAPRP